MICPKCKANEIDESIAISEWSTDENGAPIKILVCPICVESIEETRQTSRDERSEKNLSGVIVVTSDSIPTMKISKLLGPVRGGTVRAKHAGRDITAQLKNVVGGEIKGYTELLAEAREEALYRMKSDAESLGANAVIAFRYSTAMIEPGSAEVTAYGTGVVVEPLENQANAC